MKNVPTIIAAAIRSNPLLKILVKRAGSVLRRTVGPALDLVKIEWSVAEGTPADPGLRLALVGRRRRVDLKVRPADIADPHRLWDICERLWSTLRRLKVPA